jgi:ATP-binding protein involved in chromosome partitioning
VSLTVEAVQVALKGLIDPNTQIDFMTSKNVKNVKVDSGNISLDVVLGYPAKSQFDSIRKSVIATLRELPEVKNVLSLIHI